MRMLSLFHQNKKEDKANCTYKQFEWINEIEPRKYLHEKGERIAEWEAEHLNGRKREKNSIADKLVELKR